MSAGGGRDLLYHFDELREVEISSFGELGRALPQFGGALSGAIVSMKLCEVRQHLIGDHELPAETDALVKTLIVSMRMCSIVSMA
jgi:hypothetical protein